MAKVFIGNLPDAAKGNDVEDFFSKYGRIREINLKSGYGKFNRSKDNPALDNPELVKQLFRIC